MYNKIQPIEDSVNRLCTIYFEILLLLDKIHGCKQIRKMRNQRKHKQPPRIFMYILRVKISFRDKITHNRTRDPADHMQYDRKYLLAALKNKNGHLILWNDLQVRYFNYNNR